ncbi:MAG: hypothetical protein K8T20_04240 [Planctomycetes bacterium]|nr:hypothetical protein [Planctomycetota bacterium]
MSGNIHESHPSDAPIPPDASILKALTARFGADVHQWFRKDTAETVIACPNPEHGPRPRTPQQEVVLPPSTINLVRIGGGLHGGTCTTCGAGVYGESFVPWVGLELMELQKDGREPHQWALKGVSRLDGALKLKMRHTDRREVIVSVMWNDSKRAAESEPVALSCISRNFASVSGRIRRANSGGVCGNNSGRQIFRKSIRAADYIIASATLRPSP